MRRILLPLLISLLLASPVLAQEPVKKTAKSAAKESQPAAAEKQWFLLGALVAMIMDIHEKPKQAARGTDFIISLMKERKLGGEAMKVAKQMRAGIKEGTLAVMKSQTRATLLDSEIKEVLPANKYKKLYRAAREFGLLRAHLALKPTDVASKLAISRGKRRYAPIRLVDLAESCEAAGVHKEIVTFMKLVAVYSHKKKKPVFIQSFIADYVNHMMASL